ncbi:MAG: M28 family peptidase [Acidobacteria bacterium]|nr:M28 family peptidase [Acidobacteriota bacterium]
MRLRYSRIIVLTLSLLVTWGSSARAQLEFLAVEKDVVEQRFRRNKFGNGKRSKEVTTLFEETGCPREHLSLEKVKRSSNPNVACTLPGTTDAVIVVGAHFDAVETSSGAIDNWSGASLLPSLYFSLSHPQRKHTFVFIGFTDEEKGLFGSKFYVKQLTDEAKSKVRAMINLDTLGLSPTKIGVSGANPGLVDAIGTVAGAMKLPMSGPSRIKSWSLTSLQQRLMKTGGRLVKHARYYLVLLAEGHLNRRLFGEMLARLAALPAPGG